MSLQEPSSWQELGSWLHEKLPEAHYPSLFGAEDRLSWRSVGSVQMSIALAQGRNAQAVGKAAKQFADLQEVALLAISDDSLKCLVMRLWAVQELARELCALGIERIPFPGGAFQETLAWLLIDWWAVGGIAKVAHQLFASHAQDAIHHTTSRGGQ